MSFFLEGSGNIPEEKKGFWFLRNAQRVSFQVWIVQVLFLLVTFHLVVDVKTDAAK